jgi:hypothetical protein
MDDGARQDLMMVFDGDDGAAPFPRQGHAYGGWSVRPGRGLRRAPPGSARVASCACCDVADGL